ncbi:MAG: tetratricopeptide repeat protein [Pseudomonadota bacterium]
MQSLSSIRRISQWLVLATMLSCGVAMAQTEPTLNQVYATAQAGKLDQAQVMIQQVLVGHPNSAKAHFVRAELYARQGDLARARESLATADKLSPGLAFAKPEAVQALRAQLLAKNGPKLAANSGTTGNSGNGVMPHRAAIPDTGDYAAPAQPSRSSSFSWGMPLLLGGVAIAVGYFIFRRRAPAAPQQTAYGSQGGLGGPQAFGMEGGAGAPQPGYPTAGGFPQQPGSGLGGRIMGGVATGLAVGAGVMAAEAIARNLGGHNNNTESGRNDHALDNGHQPIPDSNLDMGGADFGINDGASWDDGGGDWDN